MINLIFKKQSIIMDLFYGLIWINWINWILKLIYQ